MIRLLLSSELCCGLVKGIRSLAVAEVKQMFRGAASHPRQQPIKFDRFGQVSRNLYVIVRVSDYDQDVNFVSGVWWWDKRRRLSPGGCNDQQDKNK